MPSRRVFVEEMEKLDREVTEMADCAREAIEKGVDAFVKGDNDLRREVERLDEKIYALELQIEKHCLDLIALHAPVASDLRTVSTCLKIITDLNRIGRYALDISEFTDILNGQKHFKKMVSIPYMADLVVAMVSDAVSSFVHRNADEAVALFERDDEVDHLWESIFREVLTYMIEEPSRITLGTHYVLVARYLERIADHSCNIAERVVYMVTGKRIKQKDIMRPDEM